MSSYELSQSNYKLPAPVNDPNSAKKSILDMLDQIKVNMKIDSELVGKRGMQLEVDKKLNELVSSGDGVNLTLFNPVPNGTLQNVEEIEKISSIII